MQLWRILTCCEFNHYYSNRGCIAVVCVVQGFFIFLFNALCNRKVCASFFVFLQFNQNLIVEAESDRIGKKSQTAEAPGQEVNLPPLLTYMYKACFCRVWVTIVSITPPCYNNTTLGNCLYAQRNGPNVTNPICWTCKNCSYECAADCEHCVTQPSTQQFW